MHWYLKDKTPKRSQLTLAHLVKDYPERCCDLNPCIRGYIFICIYVYLYIICLWIEL